jgi:hypothetical protein
VTLLVPVVQPVQWARPVPEVLRARAVRARLRKARETASRGDHCRPS